MRHFAWLIALLASTTAAHADSLGVAAKTPIGDQAMALAVNSPLGWIGGVSVGASLYARVGRQHAMRLNVASYEAGKTGAAVAGVILDA